MLTVAPAPRYRMTAAPLVQALAQVNFPIMPKLQTVDGIAPLQERPGSTGWLAPRTVKRSGSRD